MKLYKSELLNVEIPVDKAVSKVNIKLNSNLKAVNILALEALNKNVFPFTSEGKPVVDNVLFNQAFLVLNVDGAESIQMPLSLLKRAKAEGISGDVSVNGLTELSGQRVDWEKCFISFGAVQDTTAMTAGTSFAFVVHYAPTR